MNCRSNELNQDPVLSDILCNLMTFLKREQLNQSNPIGLNFLLFTFYIAKNTQRVLFQYAHAMYKQVQTHSFAIR